MNEIETTAPAPAKTPETSEAGKSPLYAIVDIAAWLWPRRRLIVAELRASQARARTPKRPTPPSRRLRFAV